MTGIDRFAGAVLIVALTAMTMAQELTLPPEAVRLRMNHIVTVCGEAVDLACDGPHRNAILTFVTPSQSGSVTIAAAAGAQIDLNSWPLTRVQHVCVTGTVAAAASGRQLRITSRDQIVFDTKPALVETDLGDRPHRSCEPGSVSPTLRWDVKPLYTADAMRRKVSGRVTLQGLVDRNGLVGDVQVIRTLDPGGLDVTAADAFGQWQFDPGRFDGQPVPMFVVIDMTFTTRR